MSEQSMAQLIEQFQAVVDQQEMTVYCKFCPRWKAEGTAEQTRTASVKHREEKHPELTNRRRIVRKRRSFSQSMTAEREEQIETERRQRMRALGLP